MLIKVLTWQRAASFMAAAAVLWTMSPPVWAFTCEDVRRLTPTEQNFYAKLFHIGAAQQRQILVSCYTNYHPGRTRVEHR